MKKYLDTILIEGLKVKTIIGILEHEKITPQDIIINCKLYCDLSLSSNTDNIKDTINYAEFASMCKEYLSNNSHLLIEHLGMRIIQNTFQRFSMLEEIDITIKKISVVANTDFVGVRLVRSKDQIK